MGLLIVAHGCGRTLFLRSSFLAFVKEIFLIQPLVGEEFESIHTYNAMFEASTPRVHKNLKLWHKNLKFWFLLH